MCANALSLERKKKCFFFPRYPKSMQLLEESAPIRTNARKYAYDTHLLHNYYPVSFFESKVSACQNLTSATSCANYGSSSRSQFIVRDGVKISGYFSKNNAFACAFFSAIIALRNLESSLLV